jgi:hypothetical protein
MALFFWRGQTRMLLRAYERSDEIAFSQARRVRQLDRLPKDVLARLGVAAGDTLNASIDDVGVTISGPMTTAKCRWPSRAT